jgi:hypothetical protein
MGPIIDADPQPARPLPAVPVAAMLRRWWRHAPLAPRANCRSHSPCVERIYIHTKTLSYAIHEINKLEIGMASAWAKLRIFATKSGRKQ